MAGRGIKVFTDSRRRQQGTHRPCSEPRFRRRWVILVTIIGAVVVAMTIALVFAVPGSRHSTHDVLPTPPRWRDPLPVTPGSYIGVYGPGAPDSYAGVAGFSAATGFSPQLVVYYSGWFEPFKARFAANVRAHGAVPLVQINPTGIRLASIASGRYDAYLTSYAGAVRNYGRPVILSFGHEMNGNWYSWGHQHASPATFVAAWRHIVTLFSTLRVRNVTWLWTVNIMHQGGSIANPAAWWPGSRFVTWVGLDGYYYKRSWKFAPLFGPTIAAVRQLTHDPILIAETGAAPSTDQSAKIHDLFAGIHLYGLLGFIWFDAARNEDWRLNSPAAISAFQRSARIYHRPAS
jgi:mannan endo-1,4-beta-mannosidase